MSQLITRAVARPSPAAGSFGAEVVADRLELPAEVHAALTDLSIRSAEAILSYAATFPSAVAGTLGWQVDQVAIARQELAEQLTGLVEPALLTTGKAFRRGMGARNPLDLPKQR